MSIGEFLKMLAEAGVRALSGAQAAAGVTGIAGMAGGAIIDPSGGILNPVERPLKLGTLGDSFMGNSNRTLVGTSAPSLAGGIITLPITGHGLIPGTPINVTGLTGVPISALVNIVPTIVDANNISIPAGGATSVGVLSYLTAFQVQDLKVLQANGLATYLSRRSLGAFSIIQAGMPGYRVSSMVVEAATRVRDADVIVWWGDFNSVRDGETADQIIGYIDQMRLAIGKPFIMVGPIPWASGSTADTAANRQTLLDLRRKMAAYAKARAIPFVDLWTSVADPATGYAKTSPAYVESTSPKCHPTAITQDTLASLLMSGVFKGAQPWPLIASGLDNFGTNALSKNVVDNMPHTATTGGGLGANISAAVPSGRSGTAGAPSGWTVSGSSVPVSGGSAWINASPDGVGFAAACRYALTANNQQGRISYSMNVARLTPGTTMPSISFGFLVDTNGSTIQTQNIVSVTAQILFTVDGVDRTYYDARSVQPLAEMPNGATMSGVALFQDILIPAGASLTAARIDIIVAVGGAGTFDLMAYRSSALNP